MTIEERLSAVEQEVADLRRLRLQTSIKDLEEASLVMSQIEARPARAIKEHSEWLAAHNHAIKEHDRAMREIDKGIEALVSAIGKLIPRQQ